MTTPTKITLPAADELDTGDCPSGMTTSLYLIPAAEADGDCPEVTFFRYIGNSWPCAAHYDLWMSLGSYGDGVVGASILAALQPMADALVTASDMYLGSEWDGSNTRGQWDDDVHTILPQLDCAELDRYWDASDWMVDGDDWEDICQSLSLPPSSSADTIAAGLENVAESEGQQVRGIGRLVQDSYQTYQDRQPSPRGDVA